jgi:hypothetical protein
MTPKAIKEEPVSDDPSAREKSGETGVLRSVSRLFNLARLRKNPTKS